MIKIIKSTVEEPMAALFGSKPASTSTSETKGSGANLWIAASDGDLKRVKELAAVAAADVAVTAATASSDEGAKTVSVISSSAAKQAARTACLSAKDEHGYSALHAASSYGHGELLKFLLAEGVSPDLLDEDGDTALHVCATGECAELLLEAGADGSTKNDEGKTPAEANAEHVVQLLQVLGAAGKEQASVGAGAGAATATIKEAEEEEEEDKEKEGGRDQDNGDDLSQLQTMTTAAELLGLEPDAASAREELAPLLQVALVLAKAGHGDIEMVKAMAVLAQGVLGGETSAESAGGVAAGGSGGKKN